MKTPLSKNELWPRITEENFDKKTFRKNIKNKKEEEEH